MKINKIGYHYIHNSDFFISRPHGSGDNVLILLKSPAIFRLNGKDVKAHEGSFILYRNGTPQFYRADETEFVNDWFHFSYSEEEKGMFENYKIPFDTVLEIGDISELSMLIKNMSYETYSANLYRAYTLELYLKLFFVKLGEKFYNYNDRRALRYYELMSAIRSKIYSTPQHEWSVKELANEMAMSVSYFEHTYKDMFGVSVMNEVINSRVEYAKFMLSTTDIPIGYISEMCGYKNEVHFMKQFKSRTNATPSQYREANKTTPMETP